MARGGTKPPMRFETLAIHGGPTPDPAYGAVMPPVYQVSTFAFKGVRSPGPFDYTRSGNPTRKALEDTLAALDGGASGFAFATGMAAEATVLDLLKAGDHLLVHDDLYGGTHRLVTQVTAGHGVDVSFVDFSDGRALESAIRPNTKALWFESVTNPLINVLDLPEISKIARARGILTVCDNTFLSPYFLRPLEHGVDIVVHSTTKYLNGHSDVVGGAAVVADPALAERIAFLQNAAGSGQAPWDAYLVLRGIRTLTLRMQQHDRSALALARWLERHAKVAEVRHAGLDSHPQHALAQRLFTGYGGTFSFRVVGGGEAVDRLLGAVRLFTLAESLGGVESLIEHPWTMTHASMPEAARRTAGITEDLVRISVGLEHLDDLTLDLEQAFNRV